MNGISAKPPGNAARTLRPIQWLCLSALFACSPAFAETLYVTDILRLGLHRSSDTSDAPFRTLVSGDPLEILERSTYYARVRTGNGDEGWVKASYLTDEEPAQKRLADLTSERDRLSSDVASLRAELGSVGSELTEVRTARNELQHRADAVESEASDLRATNTTLNEKVAANRFSVHAQWVALTAALMLVGGFVAGWWWADAKQRARHGGFRI